MTQEEIEFIVMLLKQIKSKVKGGLVTGFSTPGLENKWNVCILVEKGDSNEFGELIDATVSILRESVQNERKQKNGRFKNSTRNISTRFDGNDTTT